MDRYGRYERWITVRSDRISNRATNAPTIVKRGAIGGILVGGAILAPVAAPILLPTAAGPYVGDLLGLPSGVPISQPCVLCSPLDLLVMPAGEGPRPPIHPMCRCKRIPLSAEETASLDLVAAGVTYRRTLADWYEHFGDRLAALAELNPSLARITPHRRGRR